MKIAKKNLYQFAASIESLSSHPLAEAIVNNAREKNIEIFKADEYELIPGRGMSAMCKGVKIYAGNAKLMQELGIDVSESCL